MNRNRTQLSKSVLTILLWLALPIAAYSQHTFSIVAIDESTGEIGSAGATCLEGKRPQGGCIVISDIVLGVGAINTQAKWRPRNQEAARARMEAGDSPAKIIAWLQENDAGDDGRSIDFRQYGIVAFHDGKIMAAAHTGSENPFYASHRIGPNYCIQGNILLDESVLLDMEEAFLATKGSLADKLMAAMQGAKRVGADSRCAPHGVSSLSAFLRVAKPGDKDSSRGQLSLDINIYKTPEGVDPIDQLQVAYDRFKVQSD